ncbi:MAG: hypothetical protein PHQ92_10735 [Petrimonas sp.]|nr:hypothetical protein [Petrimonas sp.]
MKTFRLFSSVYKSVDIMLASKIRDEALDVQNNSVLVSVQANSLNEAVEKYTMSDEYTDFTKGKDTIYFYYLDEKGSPESVV